MEPEKIRELYHETMKDKLDVLSEEEQVLCEELFLNMSEGMLPYDAMGLSTEMLEWIYARGYEFYTTGKYEEASKLFSSLMLMNPLEGKYYHALGSCYHMQEKFDLAIQMYTAAILFNPDDPIPHYYIANCHIQKEEKFWALYHLETLIDQIKDNSKYLMVKTRAQMNAKNIKRELEEEGIITTKKSGTKPKV